MNLSINKFGGNVSEPDEWHQVKLPHIKLCVSVYNLSHRVTSQPSTLVTQLSSQQPRQQATVMPQMPTEFCTFGVSYGYGVDTEDGDTPYVWTDHRCTDTLAVCFYDGNSMRTESARSLGFVD